VNPLHERYNDPHPKDRKQVKRINRHTRTLKVAPRSCFN
jgi:hypothetical protein